MRLTNLVVVLATSTALLLEPSYSAQSRTAIDGIVLEAETEQPLEGVTVSAVSSEQTYKARTDSAGRFTIELAMAGRYRVIPARDGMVYARPARLQAPREPGVWVEVSAGQVHDPQLRMVPEAVISGRVVDSNNNVFPASRGKVTVLRYIYDERGRKTLAQAPVVHEGAIGTHGRMDDRGDYRLYGLQPGDYYISASGAGNMVFYPGTPDETSAEPVRVRAGEELRLPTIVLPAAQQRTPVRLRPVGLEGESLGETVDSGALSFQFDSGRVLSFFSQILFSRQMPPDPGVRSTELVPGKYDVLIGLNGMRTTAELFYAHAAFTVGNTEMEQEVRLNRGIRVTGSFTLEDAAGSHPNPPGVLCRLYTAERHLETVGASTSKGCLGAAFSPAHYDLEMMGMPPDAYVETAQAGGEDILANGLQLSGDTELKLVIRSPGSVIEGTVTDSRGEKLSDAVVALVPDAPLRAAGVLYRSVISDVNGRYQLRGIAPGSYQLFAWTELEGAAYRNAKFMKDFDGKGRPVRVQAVGRISIDLTAF